MKKAILFIICLIVFSLMSGCIAQKDMLKEREAFAKKADEDIVIGMPGPIEYMKDLTGFHNGVMLAVEEINSNDGIKGRMIKTRFEDDKGSFSDGMKVAQEFAAQKDMIAVIGHWNTYITLLAARIYNDAGLVMLSPVVSNADITKKGYKYVFQNTINDNDMGRQMAGYANEKSYKHIVVFYADNDYGNGLASAFEDFASDYGSIVVDRMTEFVNEQEFDKAYDKWKAFEYDAVFIADSMPHAGEFIKKLRAKDGSIPIFAGDGMDVANLPDELGRAAEGLAIATMYNPEQGDVKLKEFIQQYKSKYNSEPDVWAIQGYDSIKLLAYAMQKAEVPTPSRIAEVLRNDKEWEGVLGSAQFDSNGAMTGRNIYMKVIQGDGSVLY